jgi:hypothetical protein
LAASRTREVFSTGAGFVRFAFGFDAPRLDAPRLYLGAPGRLRALVVATKST